MPRLNKLTVKQVEHAHCPEGKPYASMSDGGYLSLCTYPSGRSVYRVRIKCLNGQESLLTLGPTSQISLKEARQLRDKLVEARLHGKEPTHVLKKLRGKGEMTVADLVLEYLCEKRPTWGESTYKNEKQRAKKYLIESPLCSIPIHSFTLEHVYDFARRMDEKGYKTQHKKVISLLKCAFDLGSIKYGVEKLDVSAVKHFLVKHKAQHHAYVEVSNLPALSKQVTLSRCSLQVKLLFDFTFLTLQRAQEATQNTWNNVDFDNATLTIPKKLAKNKQEHIVPLSPHAIRVLILAKALAGDSEYIFPSPQVTKNQPIHKHCLGTLFRKIGLQGQMTGHGIRAMFSTEMHEELDTADSIIIEMILSHTDKDQIRAAYNRRLFIERRRGVLNHWGQIFEKMTRKHSCSDYVEMALIQLELLPATYKTSHHK
ncbi:tyrosine-type recombinase/integrase [Vibrio alfacsensis]|uniref:tyrosine-type recombinase/integrase n=1 Tax=Vibrio alfacsensis TaxID=1074311 RepID=UPI004067C6D4